MHANADGELADRYVGFMTNPTAAPAHNAPRQVGYAFTMKTFTTVVCILGAIGGFGRCALAFANAQGAVHEVEGLIGALIGVCGVGFAGVIQGQK
jgi:hypothetical protein